MPFSVPAVSNTAPVRASASASRRLDAAVGDAVAFDQVLLVGEGANVKVGAPLVKGGKVEAKVVSQGREDKIMIIKFRRRKHYRRTQGHRQPFTEVEITAISGA